MKKMRKLIPAFAMLMVAAVMMSTASFAWFTMSTSATADGMTVKATTSGGLAIAFAIPGGSDYTNPGDDAFHSNVTFNSGTDWTNGATALSPTSTNGTNWYKAESDNTNTATAKAGTYAEVTTGLEGYYYKTVLYVKSLDQDADTDGKDLFVDQITVTNTSHGLEKSLRVAIKVGTEWMYFAPYYASDAGVTLKYVKSVTGSGVSQTVETAAYASGKMFLGADELTGAKLLTGALEYSTPTAVEVYIYFEGEDTNCKTDLAYDLTQLGIGITFADED